MAPSVSNLYVDDMNFLLKEKSQKSQQIFIQIHIYVCETVQTYIT